MSISFNLNTLQQYLDSNNVNEYNKNIILDLFTKADVSDDYNQQVKDNQLTRDEVPNFRRMLGEQSPSASKIVENFLKGLKPQTVSINHNNLTQEELNADKKNLEDKIKTVFKSARKRLIREIKKGNLNFPHPISGESISANNLLKSLNKLEFEPEAYGSARASSETMSIIINTTPSDGTAPAPLSCQWNCTEEEAMKILLHEALHNEYAKQGANSGFNTQEEELYVEKNAIILLSQIVGKENTMIYNTTLSDLVNDNKLLDSILQKEFINKNYKHRPKDSTGAVNIMGKELTTEDKVYLDGDFCGNIGIPPNGCLFDQLHDQDIRVAGKLGGRVVLSPVNDSPKIEVKDVNGNIKFEAYLIPYNDFGL